MAKGFAYFLKDQPTMQPIDLNNRDRLNTNHDYEILWCTCMPVIVSLHVGNISSSIYLFVKICIPLYNKSWYSNIIVRMSRIYFVYFVCIIIKKKGPKGHFAHSKKHFLYMYTINKLEQSCNHSNTEKSLSHF